MTRNQALVSDVSDTARWVAMYRAIESARPDAVFRDRLADRLAGDRGRAIYAALPRSMRNGWWIVARTAVIDDYVRAAVAQGCDRVINLAAGFDARPFRLDLPGDLEWVEADLPALVAQKRRLLAEETPRCRLTMHAVDLNDAGARADFLDKGLAGATNALVLTEGLLMYLAESEVRALSQALARPEIAWWIAEVASAGLVERMRTRTAGLLGDVPMQFGAATGLAYFEDLGWQVAEWESLLVAARRMRRLPLWLRPLAALPQPDPRHPGDKLWSAIARFARPQPS